MGEDIRKVINLVGVALVLGLMFQYSKEVSYIIQVSGSTINDLYKTVSLQNLNVQRQG